MIMSTQRGSCTLLLVVLLAGCYARNAAAFKCPISTDIVFESFAWNAVANEKIAKWSAKVAVKAIGPLATDYYSHCEWEHVLGIDPLSPDHITLELVDLLNDTAWKVVQAGDLLLLDIGHMGVYDDAKLGDVDFSQELKNSGALLSYAVSIFAKVVNKACGVETPTLGDNASVIHGLYNLILKAVKAVRRVPITPAPVKNAAKAVEDGLEDPQVKALEDALEEVIEQDKGTCKGAIMKRVKAFVTSEYFICFRAIIARYARVLTWVKAGLLTVEDVVRGATNAAMEAREASRGVMRPRNHPWGVMTWSQQGRRFCRCDLFPPSKFGYSSIWCATDSSRKLLANDSQATPAAEEHVDHLMTHSPHRMLISAGLSSKTVELLRELNSAATDMVSAIESFMGGIDAVEDQLRKLPLSEVASGIRVISKVGDLLDVIAGPIGRFGYIFDGIAGLLSKLECPRAISFICNLAEILNSMIEDLLDSALKAITGKPLEEWVKDALDELGLTKVAKSIPGAGILTDAFKGIASLGNTAYDGLMGHYKELKDKLTRFTDIRTYDPDFLEFGPSGKQVRQGVVRKVQYAFASAPLDFVCEADETPVVEAAVRTLYNCKQTLSPYIRYPCPGKGGCTLDYNTTWPPMDCLNPLLNPLIQSPEEVSAIRGLMDATAPLQVEDYFRTSYYCVKDGADFTVMSELMTAEADLGINTYSTAVWANTAQTKHTATPGMKAVGSGGTQTSYSCSNGNRVFWLEYLKAPTSGGQYAWAPCLSSWPRNRGNLTDYYNEFCWWWGWQQQANKPPIIAEGDTSYLPYSGLSDAEKRRYYAMQANLPYDCMGDAHGAYVVLWMDVDNTWCVEDSDRGARVKNWPNCMRVSNGDLNPKGADWACNPERYCYGYASSNWRSVGPAYPYWTPAQVCSWNYDLPEKNDRGGTVDRMGSAFDGNTPTFARDANHVAGLRAARLTRQNIISEHDVAAQDTSGPAAACTSIFNNCHGRQVCEMEACVAEKMQWSCVDAGEFAAVAGSSPVGGLVLMFGSDKPGPRRTTITCPEGDTASIKLASYGGGLTNQDVTDTMAEGCSESSCIIDMDELPEPAGKTLRVEYACACGAGKKAQRDASTRECELCPAGQARMPAQPDCQVCAEGTYQDEAGQSTCKVCPAGHWSPRGVTSCTPCAAGTFTAEANSTSCTLAPKNTFTNATGATAATACGDAYYTIADGSTSCLPCPGGTTRVGQQTDCSPCPAGSFSAPGAVCAKCPAGSYAPTQGSTECLSCPVGTYNPVTGASTCTLCPRGLITRQAARTSAADCNVADVYLDYDYIAAELAAGRQPPLPPGAARVRAPASNSTAGGSQRQLLASGGSYYSSKGGKRMSPLAQKKAKVLTMLEYVKQFRTAPTAWKNGFELHVDYNIPREDSRASRRSADTAPAASMVVNPAEDAGAGAPSPSVQAPAPDVASTVAIDINMTRCNALLDFFGATASELGNGVCSNGPYNTEACGWDLGDCCASTCQSLVVDGAPAEWTCRNNTMSCRDPTALRAEADAGTQKGTCNPSGITAASAVPASFPSTCPVAADNARLGNGVCDGELNIPACKYDGGDCCSTTCQRSPLVLDGCRPDKFDCRDPAASVDTQAPKLFGVPSNYSVVAESRLNATQQPVLAVDNFPCFDPDTQVTTQVLTPHPRTHACDSKILYYVERSWEATDRVGNTGSASAVLTVLDDQVVDPLVASFTVPKGSSKKPKFRTVVLNLDARPNKRYVWTVRPWAGGQVVTREGATVAMTFAMPKPQSRWRADFYLPITAMNPSKGPFIYNVTLTTSYDQCNLVAGARPRYRTNAGFLRVYTPN